MEITKKQERFLDVIKSSDRRRIWKILIDTYQNDNGKPISAKDLCEKHEQETYKQMSLNRILYHLRLLRKSDLVCKTTRQNKKTFYYVSLKSIDIYYMTENLLDFIEKVN